MAHILRDKKFLSVFLACALMLGFLPYSALAADTGMGQPQADGTTPPDMPGSNGGDGSAPPDAGGAPPDGGGQAPGGGAPGGADTMTFDYSGSYTGVLSADGESVTGQRGNTYDASEIDQNAALAQNGGSLDLDGVTLTKSGDDTNGDNCNFYGVNSIALSVGEGSAIEIQNSNLSATSQGSNALFATDSGTIYANASSIQTEADNSRGLDATYGGTIVAANLTIETHGAHSASLATDRGGGNISVRASNLSTEGEGSPLIYSTGNIQVSDVIGEASGSQIAGLEGQNTILINNSQLTSTITQATASDPVANGIIIYQSTSGDAEAASGETATVQIVDSTLTSAIRDGAMFYLTNTTADVMLQNTTLDFDTSAADLMRVASNNSNNWGSFGSNGANVRLTASDQELEGTITVDNLSSASVYLTNGSTWTGHAQSLIIDYAQNTDQGADSSASSDSSGDMISVSLDSTSKWVLTQDCYIDSLAVEEGAQIVDESGNTVPVKSSLGMVLAEGDSDITLYLTGSSLGTYNASDAGTLVENFIDRAEFDSAFGTSTTYQWGSEGAYAAMPIGNSSSSAAGTTAQGDDASTDAQGNFLSSLIAGIQAFFVQIANLFAA